MFKTWGQKMKPWRKYPMTITKPLHISSVVIDKGETAKLYVTNGKNTFIVATLSKVIPQAQLDLNFSKDDKIKFITKGDATVSLLGYTQTIDFFESLGEDENGSTPFSNGFPSLSFSDFVDKLIVKKGANDHNGVAKKEKEAKQAQAQKSQPELKKDHLKTKKHAIKPSAGGGRTITGGVKITDVMSGKGDEAKPGNNYPFSNGFSLFSNGFSPFSIDCSPFSNGFSPFSNGFSPFPNGFSLFSSADSDGEEQPKAKVAKLIFKKGANNHNGVAKKEKEAKQAQAQKSQSEVKKDNLKTKKHAIKPSAGRERTITGGVKITDVMSGKGDEAKPGNNVWVHYVGRLQSNNKTFERVLDGKGAKLRLGYSKVIKGFNIGLIGMKVGGKRRITCPPHMAYGKAGCPPFIPPNSTVVFEVELKAVR